MEEKKIVKTHNLKYDNGKKVSLSGIKNVESFSESHMLLTLDNEKTLTIDGIGLSVTNLDVENGNMELDGELVKISYANARTPKSFLKKLFK